MSKSKGLLALAKVASSKMNENDKLSNYLNKEDRIPSKFTEKGFLKFVESVTALGGEMVNKDEIVQTFGEMIGASIPKAVEEKRLEFSGMPLTKEQKILVEKRLIITRDTLVNLQVTAKQYTSHPIFATLEAPKAKRKARAKAKAKAKVEILESVPA